MEHEGDPYHDQASPVLPPNHPPARWKVPRVAVTVGLAAMLGMAGAGVAFATTGPGSAGSSGSLTSNSKSSTATHPAGHPTGRHAMGRWGPGGGPAGMGRGVLHGIYTVRNGSSYLAEEVQRGAVQSGNTGNSITVKSKDGYTQTYTVQPSTVVDSQAGGISTIKPGDRVMVRAIQKNGVNTATDIVDLNQIASSRRGFGFARPGASPSTGSNAAPAA